MSVIPAGAPAAVSLGLAQETLDAFFGHYTGCRTLGLSSEQFVRELSADAVPVMTLGLDGRGYGYDGLDFDGWLVEGSLPEALKETLQARLAMPVTVLELICEGWSRGVATTGAGIIS